MNYKNYFSFLLLVGAVLLFGARPANACSCIGRGTVLDALDDANNVVVTRIVSVEKTDKAAPKGRMSDGENYVNGVKSTRMIVERVYKGTLKVGDEITFAQGGGGDCIWTFEEEEVGQQYLFYLNSREKNAAIWYATICGRSNKLRHANDDLLYLNNLERVRGKTRISGTLRFYDHESGSVEGRKIRITGAKKTYELETNKQGVYEIYDLPPGQYQIETEPPAGWKLSGHAGKSSDEISKAEPRKVPVTLEPRKHANRDIYFEIDNIVRGKVYDPNGNPMKDVCLHLVQALVEASQYFYKADCTDEDGRFAITEVPAGSYYLVANEDGRISSTEPFKKLYYPGVSEREKAAVVTIGAGETLEGFDVRVPHTEEWVTVEGVLLYSDGKPVVDETVEFTSETVKSNFDGVARSTTDASGRFSIKILKGFEGALHGGMFSYIGEFEKCSKLEAIIKKAGDTSLQIRTDAIKLQGERDLKDLELRFPFPGCKKAKSESMR